MKRTILLITALASLTLQANAQLTSKEAKGERKMWASINVVDNASLGDYKQYNGKVLINWRMLPTDTWETSFYLYRRAASNTEGSITRMVSKPITVTNYQMAVPTADQVIYLVRGDYFTGTAPLTIAAADRTAFKAAALDSILIDERIRTRKLPYLSIPLQDTEDCSDYPQYLKYQANDCSVGDLDGDGEMEIIVKRLLTVYDDAGNITGASEAASDTDPRARHIIIWDAYKMDGTLLWRVKSGPNIIAGNSSAVTIGDLDGDGCCEFVLKTSEGTVFGDGYEIPDTDGDNKTDYRDIWPAGHYTGDGPKGYGGPEFFSVVDGKTGRELARANFIARGKEGETPAQLAANYYENDWNWDPRTKKYWWKLANSLRMGLASFDGKGLQIFLGRGVYGRTVVEGWRYEPTPNGDFAGSLTRMWKFDTMDAGGEDKNKDGKPNSAYAGQGNHAFNVADLDGDGRDEVMYGSCAFDDDGTGLWTTGLGHGDANHVGRFLPDREGLQMYHCLENGKTNAALHDVATGETLWASVGTEDGDCGRCLVADIDPSSPGCEIWWAGSNAYSNTGKDLGYKPSSCNMAIWFDGTLSRQLINEHIIDSPANGRTFTIYRYEGECVFNNSSKSNPGWYGDFLGDWREEFIVPDNTRLDHINIFSTWYPTEYKLPYLMSDHTYMMQCIHENVGYNQPTHVGGYYLGTDMDFSKVPLVSAQEEVKGDVDGDGQLTLADVKAVVTLYASGAETWPAAADLDQNGRLTISDVTALMDLYRNAEK